jgi:hypothetical protein
MAGICGLRAVRGKLPIERIGKFGRLSPAGVDLPRLREARTVSQGVLFLAEYV